jgi:hypothetical protein
MGAVLIAPPATRGRDDGTGTGERVRLEAAPGTVLGVGRDLAEGTVTIFGRDLGHQLLCTDARSTRTVPSPACSGD